MILFFFGETVLTKTRRSEVKKDQYPLCPCTSSIDKEEFTERSRTRPFNVTFNLIGGRNQVRRLTGKSIPRGVLTVKITSGQINYNRRGRGRGEFFGFVDGFHHKPVSITISLDTQPMPKGSISCMYPEIVQTAQQTA
jgi:hypothetical protein